MIEYLVFSTLLNKQTNDWNCFETALYCVKMFALCRFESNFKCSNQARNLPNLHKAGQSDVSNQWQTLVMDIHPLSQICLCLLFSCYKTVMVEY